MSEFELPKKAQDALSDLSLLKMSAREIREEIERLTSDAQAQAGALARDRQVIDGLIQNRTEAYGLVASVWGDYERAKAAVQAKYLLNKSHPAPKAAQAVKQKGAELAQARRELKASEYVIQLYEWHFPWLTELRDAEESEAFATEGVSPHGDQADPVSGWLTGPEFNSLPEGERNQRALDRYLHSRKSNWQLGRDYERYVGYLREQEGATVTYHGIFKGLEDLGRDVIAEQDGDLEIIQCKRWAQTKTIHEKHVFQLYGTVVLARLESSDSRVRGTFTTTTQLSSKAREVAQYLDIQIQEQVPLVDYPRIKCNVSSNGEKIYHLPFDQQYDRTIIDRSRSECYVNTVEEAESLGFRRAWRWRGES